MDETVRVEFNPPRHVEEVGKALKLTADGEDTIWLPMTVTTLHRKDEKAVAATMPSYIAEDRELVIADCFQEEQTHDKMSRNDCFLLGMAMALVSRGETPNHNIPCEARKLARRLQGDT